MILLYNVYLDDKVRDPGLYYRGNYGLADDTIRTFKYTLASVVDAYPWKKVIINVELNPTLSDKEEELLHFIRELFSSHDLHLKNKRCEYQKDWQDLYSNLDDDLIYFCCNHDHVFTDNDPTNFIDTVSEFRNEFRGKEATLYFSHWPELLSSFSNDPGVILRSNFAYGISDNIDSIQIITRQVYHRWWFSKDFNHMFLPRTDYFGGSQIPTGFFKPQAVPYREHFRHFDGYTHVAELRRDVTLQANAANICPPLFIPPGFFNNDIKLKIGYDVNCSDSVNLNLKKLKYTVVDPQGTDLKCFYDEIPFFWKSRISHIDINPEYEELLLTEVRDTNILNPLTTPLWAGSLTGGGVMDSVKSAYGIR